MGCPAVDEYQQFLASTGTAQGDDEEGAAAHRGGKPAPEVDEVPKPVAIGELAVLMRVRALALVPLVSRGSFVGLLALFWEQPHHLDQEQEALLGLAGNHIAGALAAALRYEEAERAAGQAKAVFYAIADGVLLTDPTGRVTAMNRANSSRSR